jgi:hypothetical protein
VSNPIKILFLAANPSDTNHLRLDEEVRAIDQALRKAKYRDDFELEQHWAVTASDLQEALLRHEPHIVHFSGHGSQKGEIILESSEMRGQSHREISLSESPSISKPGYVSAKALANTLAILKDNIRCVVLNACYSKIQAEAIGEHIDAVVGMSRAISDPAAILFAEAFYRSLGFGRNLNEAFRLARNLIDLHGLPEEDTPQLFAPKVNAADIKLLEAVQVIQQVSVSSVGTSDSSTSPKPAPLATQPLSVFFSYSHKDETLRDELAKHLSILQRQGVIQTWHDRRISAGTEWAGQIDDNMNSADIILLLISSDFLASTYCYDVELKRAMQRHAEKTARVIPVILRAVDWHDASFGKLQALPKDAKPITSWSNQDEAFADVAKGIRNAVADIKNERQKQPPENPR